MTLDCGYTSILCYISNSIRLSQCSPLLVVFSSHHAVMFHSFLNIQFSDAWQPEKDSQEATKHQLERYTEFWPVTKWATCFKLSSLTEELLKMYSKWVLNMRHFAEMLLNFMTTNKIYFFCFVFETLPGRNLESSYIVMASVGRNMVSANQR